MKAVIFDMDGVIIDSEPIHFQVDIEVLQSVGSDVGKSVLEKYVGMTNPEMWSDIIKTYNINESIDNIIDLQINRKIDIIKNLDINPIDGIRELLINLKKENIPIAIASSSPILFIEAVLAKFEIQDYFKIILSGEEVLKGKPAPDIYLETARLLSLNPSDCLVIEDSKNGVIAAKVAGMKCIGFQNPNSGDQDLSKADFVVNSIDQIQKEKNEFTSFC